MTKHLITKEGVSPEDICIIYNGPKAVEVLESRLGPAMADIGVELSVQTSRSFQRHKNTLLVTTSHSFKGYEAEVVLIPSADHYVTGDNQILANIAWLRRAISTIRRSVFRSSCDTKARPFTESTRT